MREEGPWVISWGYGGAQAIGWVRPSVLTSRRFGKRAGNKYPNAARDPACFDPEIGVEF